MGSDNTFGDTNFNPKMSSEPLEEKPFLTEDDCDKAYDNSPCTEALDYYSGFRAASEKANARISELESELKALREERDFLHTLVLKSESLNCNCATPNDCKELTNCALKGRKPIP